MANSRQSNKGVSKNHANYKTPGRAKPMTPRAGFTKTRRQYGNGGKTR